MMASMTTSLAATAEARSSSRLPTVTSVSKRGEKNAAGFALRAPSRPAEAGVRQVRRDGRSHDARSQYRHFTDRLGGHKNTITENRREGRSLPFPFAFLEPCIRVGVGVRRRRRAGFAQTD